MDKQVNDKQVVNLSSIPLTSGQRSVLSKGLLFCPTPGEPDKGTLREDMDRFHRDLRREAFSKNIRKPQRWRTIITQRIRSYGNLFDSKLPPFKHYKFKPKSRWNPVGPSVVEEFIFLNQEELRKRKVFAPHHKNISRDEYKAIKDLQNNKDIVY